MPKRATLTYTSEDAPHLPGDQLSVYYCKYSGKHAFTIDCDINKLPRRRTDDAIIVDTRQQTVKFYTTDGGIKLIKRKDGRVERQCRLNVGELPVAYKTTPEGHFLYVLSNAVAAYTGRINEKKTETPVPPCIMYVEPKGCQIALEVEDKATKPDIIKISADSVRIAVVSSVSHDHANEEILEFMAKVLGARLTQMSLVRGTSTRHKMLMVEHMTTQEAYQRLQVVTKK
ncbi:hypothetical protein BSKO_00474 [Bryopsis sp. KO-2023]|nr:hypothetical protein BSKO_00474 [Bryopsis sp. KO-2023]